MPVKAEWGAGAYLVGAGASAARPGRAKRMPGRSLGVAWFEIDRAARDARRSTLDAPAQMRPRGALHAAGQGRRACARARRRASRSRPSMSASSTSPATRRPNPDEYFFGQKQLATEIRDLYGYLIDGMQGTRGAIRSGGDAAAGIEGSPPTQEPLARYSGVVKVGPDGTADGHLRHPAFNGTRAGHGGRLVEGPGRQRHAPT